MSAKHESSGIPDSVNADADQDQRPSARDSDLTLTPDDLLADLDQSLSTLRNLLHRRLKPHPASLSLLLDGDVVDRDRSGPATAQDVLDTMNTSVPSLWQQLNYEQCVNQLCPSHMAFDNPLAGEHVEHAWTRMGDCLSLLNTQLTTSKHSDVLKEIAADLAKLDESDDDDPLMPPLLEPETEFDEDEWDLIAGPSSDGKSEDAPPSTRRLDELD
ncbi:hypothetical protein B0H12DRAFT_1243930 [Mycena haematopus]|nr:hypothetical protein B0H12DRAFT_1243930 [Mycena haematopus]